MIRCSRFEKQCGRSFLRCAQLITCSRPDKVRFLFFLSSFVSLIVFKTGDICAADHCVVDIIDLGDLRLAAVDHNRQVVTE